MTTDAETNFLFLADTLWSRWRFFEQLIKVLDDENIKYRFLPLTRDLWAVDYMPIQVDKGTFVQFRYDPDYLRNCQYRSTQTIPEQVCRSIGLETISSQLRIDGGNVIKGQDWVILTDKVFKENRSIRRNCVIDELEKLFQARVIIIPKAPNDYTGHADGIVRYYDRYTVLVNHYKHPTERGYESKLRQSLVGQGLRLIEIPYNPYKNASCDIADGLYVNFLQMKDFILLPTFGMEEDELAHQQFETLFAGYNIRTIDASEISKDGGVLNCISWNIQI